MNLTSRNERMLLSVLREVRHERSPVSVSFISNCLPHLTRLEVKDALNELVRCQYLVKSKDEHLVYTSVYSVNPEPRPELRPGYRWHLLDEGWCIISSRHSATMGVLILPSDYFNRAQQETRA